MSAAAVETAGETASVETAEAGLAAEGIVSRETAVIESAERAGMGAGHCVRETGTAKARGAVKAGPIRMKVVAIDNRRAMGDIRIVVVLHPAAAVPIESPMVPTPTEAA